MSRYQVVIVDDEPLQRQGLAMTTPWEKFQCEVVGECGTVVEAVSVIREKEPDIIITDICMPEQNGLEMVELLQNDTNGEFIIVTGYALFEYARKALELGVGSFLLKPVDDQELEQAIEKAIHNLEKRRPDGRLGSEYPIKNGREPSADYLRRALQYVEENCSQDLTLREVAESLNISSSYLWKLFGRHMDMTFNEFLTETRMKKALLLLKNEQMKIYEISEACGYRDYRYFSSVFKKYTGMNPTDYRKKEI